ncbi:MAG: glycosyltransferase family 1 protein [Anaerolineae bacterium]|nr:glycosyltransferase family 1 protein [Anaerolineae bacterium]
MDDQALLDLAINGVDLGRGRGGNEVYLRGLIDALCRHPAVRRLSIIVAAHQPDTATTLASRWPRASLVCVGSYHRLPYLLWQQTFALHRVPHDWFLSTYFLPPVAPRRSAVFVHDLSFRSIPHTYPLSIRAYMRVLTAWAMARAQQIVLLSQFVLAELRRFYPRFAARAHVIYPGIRSEFTPQPQPSDEEVLRRHQLTPGYVLSVSSIHPRKNTATLIRAYQLVRAQLGDACPPLVLVGQRYWGSEVLDQLDQPKDASAFRWLGYVPDEDLPALYRHATVFVYPSLYEGFGLPPVEAMACGVPVVCGDHTSLPEAVGDGALLVDVRQVQAIATGIEQLIQNNDLRAALIARGLRHARSFSWERTADQLIRLLQSASLEQLEGCSFGFSAPRT